MVGDFAFKQSLCSVSPSLPDAILSFWGTVSISKDPNVSLSSAHVFLS